MTTSILEEQIGLRQLASDTFAARWHKDWTVGSSKSWKSICSWYHLLILS